jgi:hypothetical protein
MLLQLPHFPNVAERWLFIWRRPPCARHSREKRSRPKRLGVPASPPLPPAPPLPTPPLPLPPAISAPHFPIASLLLIKRRSLSLIGHASPLSRGRPGRGFSRERISLREEETHSRSRASYLPARTPLASIKMDAPTQEPFLSSDSFSILETTLYRVPFGTLGFVSERLCASRPFV